MNFGRVGLKDNNMLSSFVENTIRQLGKSENAASVDILSTLLVSDDEKTRQAAFDALYKKKLPEVYLLLFQHLVKNRNLRPDLSTIATDRLSKIVGTVFGGNQPGLRDAAAEIILEYKIYDALPLVVSNLEHSDPKQSDQARHMLMALAESFYRDLAKAPSETDRRNLDRRREWFVRQLDGTIKRYAVHGIDETIRAMLIVAKKDYETVMTVLGDKHSAACAKTVDLLATGEHGSFIRLLLSYVFDASAPSIIDQVIEFRSDMPFVRKLLETVGPNPAMEKRDALKRFKNFDWFTPDNPELPTIVESLESSAVQLLMSVDFPKDRILGLHRFFLARGSVPVRRASSDALRRLAGGEVDKLLLEHVNDSDPVTAATIFRILKTRGAPELDQQFIRLVERPEEEIRAAIYDMVPELHADSFASRIGQLPPETVRKLGPYVRRIDPNTLKTIADDLLSPIPVRRSSACALAEATGFATDFTDRLIELVDKDAETSVRVAALSALGTVMTKEAVEVIKAFLEDRSMGIREAAATALKNWLAHYQGRQDQGR